MKVFVFDLLPYAEHLEHLKQGKELPYPLPRRHFKPVSTCRIGFRQTFKGRRAGYQCFR